MVEHIGSFLDQNRLLGFQLAAGEPLLLEDGVSGSHLGVDGANTEVLSSVCVHLGVSRGQRMAVVFPDRNERTLVHHLQGCEVRVAERSFLQRRL